MTRRRPFSMSPRIIRGASRALFDSDLIATRLALFLSEAVWAVFLFWPGDTFDRPTYSVMAAVASELMWAAVFAVTAALQIGIVVYDQCRARWAQFFAVWSAFLAWASIWMMLVGVYPPPAAIGPAISLAVSALWIAVRPLIFARWERRYAAMLG